MVNMDWICVFFKSVNVGRENMENLTPQILNYFFLSIYGGAMSKYDDFTRNSKWRRTKRSVSKE